MRNGDEKTDYFTERTLRRRSIEIMTAAIGSILADVLEKELERSNQNETGRA